MAANQRTSKAHAHEKRHAKERPKKNAQTHRHEEPRRNEDYVIRADEPEETLDNRGIGPVYEEFRFLGAYNAT